MGMLDSLKETANTVALGLAQRLAPPDVSVFNDRVATETKWTSQSKSTSNFRTYRLRTDGQRFAFKPTVVRQLLCLLLIAPGAGIAYKAWPREYLFMGLGAALIGLGALLLLKPKRRVFDAEQRQYDGGSAARSMPFSDIHALQLISRWVSGSGDSAGFEYGELNLVRHDASRVLVANDPDVDALRAAARTLSGAVGCPLWDATMAPKVKINSLEDLKRLAR